MNNTMQSLWIGGNLSTMETIAIKSFIHHGHRYHLYAYDDIPVPTGCFLMNAETILPKKLIFQYGDAAGEVKGSYSAFSNLFRYQLLLQNGGYWVDTDVICLRPFDFESKEYLFASEKNCNMQKPASCVIKTPANSLFARTCLEVCA